MKKRLIAFVCMLMAFVLCFALVACDGQTPTGTPNGPDPKPNPDPKPTVETASMTVEQALNAVDKLVYGNDGWKGTASYKLSSDNTEELKGTVALEKRGNQFEVAIDDESLILDAETGYVYEKHDDGYYATPAVTGGALDYARYLVGGQLTDELTSGKFSYDKETMTAHFEIDWAKKVNEALAPLYDAYKYNKDLNALLNAYCMQYIGTTFDALYDAVSKFVAVAKDSTVNDLLDALTLMDIDVLAILEENGIVISEEEMEIYGPRKVGEMVGGAYTDLMSMMGEAEPTDDTAEEPTEGEEEGGMEALWLGLVKAMFIDDVDEDTIEEAFATIDTLIKGVLAMKVKDTVDQYADQIPTELYVMIQNGVKFKDLKLELDVTFDNDKNITELSFAAAFAHDYKGETEGLEYFLADNNYSVQAGLKIDEYTTDIGGFEFAVAEGGVDIYSTVTHIVYSPDGTTVSVYLELGGAEVTVESIDLYVGNLLEEPTKVESSSNVMFNTITSCVEFKGELIVAFFGEEAKAGYTITAVLHYEGDSEYSTTVMLVYLNDDMDQLAELVQNVIGAVTAPTDPDVSEGEYAA